jgi:hypothetical protein
MVRNFRNFRFALLAALLLANVALIAVHAPLRAQQLPCEGTTCTDPREGYCSLCIGPEGDAVWCCVMGGEECAHAQHCGL